MNNNFDAIELPQVQVPVWSLKTVEPFKSLFPIRENVLSEIIDDMSVNGFDAGHPIVVWNMTVVDGHTRLKAAVAAGLETVPVVCRRFSDGEEALDYAIRSQRNRRNLTEAELLRCVETMYQKKKRGPRTESCQCRAGRASQDVAAVLGISSRQVEKLRAIGKFAANEVKEALASGKYTVSRAYEETMRTRRPLESFLPDPDAEAVHTVMAEIHARMNGVQIRKLVKALQLELATN